MSNLILYDAANSPCGRRVRMTLLEKGLAFEIRWLQLGLMDQKRPQYLQINPSGLVPTLLHDGHALFESNVINEYLDAVFPEPPLVPGTPELQAEMRMWMAFELEWARPFRDAIYETYGKERLRAVGAAPAELRKLIAERTANRVYADFACRLVQEPPDEPLLRERLEILDERMQWMEQRLTDGRQWLLGDDFTLADIALAPRLDMFPFIGVHNLYQRFSGIGAFMRRVQNRPSWAASDLKPAPGLSTTRVTV